MATIGASGLNLSDWARRQDPNGKVAKIVEILNDTNEILQDMTWLEGNLPTGHKTTVRSGLPSVAWRLLNYGVQPSKSRTVQVTDACGMLEAYAEVDKDLADLNGNTAEFRLSEDRSFLEAMNQEQASTLFYGNTATDPEKYLGLSARYALSSAENGGNIIKGGGTESANTSVWLIVWGPNTVHGIFPKGKMTGLQHKDLGEQTLSDSAGGRYQGYRSHYKWDCGLTLRDWRYVVRICNIDVGDLNKGVTSESADLVDLMTQAIEKIPNLGMGKAVFYCNGTIRSFLRRQIVNKSNVNLSLDEVAGKKVVAFDGIPVRKCDALLNTESTIS
jgi:hypothetical protein